jgi:hypothetical protein
VWFGAAVHPATWAREIGPLRELAVRLDAATQANLPWYRAERTRAWASVAALEGRVTEAVAGYREAIRRYVDLGLAFEAARAATAAIALVGADDPQIAGAADEAQALFERLGARPWLTLLFKARRAERPTPAATSVPVS